MNAQITSFDLIKFNWCDITYNTYNVFITVLMQLLQTIIILCLKKITLWVVRVWPPNHQMWWKKLLFTSKKLQAGSIGGPGGTGGGKEEMAGEQAITYFSKEYQHSWANMAIKTRLCLHKGHLRHWRRSSRGPCVRPREHLADFLQVFSLSVKIAAFISLQFR